MVAFAADLESEAPSGPLRFMSAGAVAVEDDGADAGGCFSASRVCSEKQDAVSFTGYVADNETGLMHARSRMYSSTLGTFISRDKAYQRSLYFLPGDGYYGGMSAYAAYFVPRGTDPYGFWGPDGHVSFPNLQNPDGSWEIDYNLEDTDPNTMPIGGDMGRHFRSQQETDALLAGDVERCDFANLERHLHQRQDVPVHYGKGYRAGFLPWQLGHGPMSLAAWASMGALDDPDHPGGSDWKNSPEYQSATEATTDWLTKFLDHCCKKSGKWVVKATEPCCDKDQPTIQTPSDPGNMPKGKAKWKRGVQNPRLPNRGGHAYITPTWDGPMTPVEIR